MTGPSTFDKCTQRLSNHSGLVILTFLLCSENGSNDGWMYVISPNYSMHERIILKIIAVGLIIGAIFGME
jgi:hypothetical protein